MKAPLDQTAFQRLRSKRENRSDQEAVIVSLFYGALLGILLLGQYLVFETYSPLPFICLLALFIHLTWIRRSVSDPFTLVLLFAFIYSAFPLFFGIPGSWPALKFGFDGAAKIYAVGSITMAFGVALTIRLIPNRTARQDSDDTPNLTLKNAGIFAAAISLPLTAIFIAQHGTVLGGGMSYGDSFEAKMTAGSGILGLAAPFAAAGVALILSSNVRLRMHHHLIALAPYAGLFVGYGQRKFFIYPAVMYAVRYVRIRSFSRLLAGILACSTAFVVTLYLGFLRNFHGNVSQGLNPGTVGKFVDNGSSTFGGEAIPVFATASAAYGGYVRALSYGGDYWRSWMLAIPHFLLPRNPFEPLNERFAHTYMPSSQVTGMGWGFSFFGEAFVVGGYPMIVLATLAMMAFFRWLYIAGGRDRRHGLLGAISLAAIPFTFWFQRNAFAYFVKEFLFTQIGAITVAYFCTLLLSGKRKRAASRLVVSPMSVETLALRPSYQPRSTP